MSSFDHRFDSCSSGRAILRRALLTKVVEGILCILGWTGREICDTLTLIEHTTNLCCVDVVKCPRSGVAHAILNPR